MHSINTEIKWRSKNVTFKNKMHSDIDNCLITKTLNRICKKSGEMGNQISGAGGEAQYIPLFNLQIASEHLN